MRTAIVVPVKDSIQTIRALTHQLSKLDQVIIAYSGSRYEEVLKEARDLDILTVKAPMGKWAAIIEAVNKYRFDGYVIVDADLPVRLSDLTRVKELLREADLVLVRRSIDDRPLPDRVLTLAFYLPTRILGLRYRDVQAGVKGFRRQLILNAYHFLPRGFLGDLVLAYYAVKSGVRVKEVPVRWRDTRSWGKRLYLFLKISLEFIKILPTLMKISLHRA